MLPDLLFVPTLIGYLSILSLLFAYGINFVYLTIRAIRATGATPVVRIPTVWPRVTVQLPIYNELYVVRRLIDAVARLDYPADRLDIQVLDDSTDETGQIVAELVRTWQSRGVDIHHVRRESRAGFKAGALAHGLTLAHGELIAIFDADFVPKPDFLIETVPVLLGDPGLAFVQTRWSHTNREFSLLTRLQALSIDGHFAVEQAGRWGAGHWFNFNGTAGVWRRAAMVDAGGWEHDTLTEDLDISYRAFLAGWRAAYLGRVDVPAELPVSFNAYRSQQHRWARGSFECAAKHLPAIWHSDIPWSRKASATLHLTGYSIHLLLLALSLLYPLLLLVSASHPSVFSPLAIMSIFSLASLAPTALFTIGQRQLGRRWVREIPTILALSALGAGMMMNTARAACQAVGGRPATFERTPKFGVRQRHEDWRRLRYQLRMDRIVIVELGLAALDAWTCWTAIGRGSWAIATYAAIFAIGLTSAVSLTLGQTLRTALAARHENVAEIVLDQSV
ncbi:MAG: glycosyltransferase family 2 protein [Candidatus Limnocylindrales bacterium]|nr:glycosyltransferase family 2 protein [Candidatus Limnocylindrales bacterium]